MSAFLKNLKALFIATDEELLEAEGKTPSKRSDQLEAEEDEVPIESTSTASKTSTVSAGSGQTTVAGDGQVQKRFLEILLKGLEEENQDGYDYLEFKQALRSLKNMEMDDGTRIQSAYAVAKTMGATKERILDSGRFYLDVLKQEETQFKQSLTNQRKSRVDGPRQELEEIDAWVREQEAEIAKIKKAIEEKQASKAGKVSAIQEAEQKIVQVQRDFEASLDYLDKQINKDLNNIEQYLT